jgi:deoxyribonuclease-4
MENFTKCPRTRFGPSGISKSFREQGRTSTKEQPALLSGMGLDAFEYSFGRGVRITQQAAAEIGREAKRYDVELSVHAPYYINLASPDDKLIESTLGHFQKSAQAAVWMGAKRIVFHPGAAGKQTRDEALMRIRFALKAVLAKLDELGLAHLALCPETMGKIGQIGDLAETIALCQLDERLIPCLDFGHLYARSRGTFGSYEDCLFALRGLEEALGFERASALHIHFSRIEYTQGGEKRHLNYEDELFGPSFGPLARALCTLDYHPIVISESKTNIAEDALTYKRIYQSIIEES